MKLRFGRTLLLLIGLGAVMVTSSAQGQVAVDPNAYLYIAHAAAGRQFVSGGNPALPVDIKVNGVCVSKGQSFGEIRGPYAAPAGSWAFDLSLADSLNPCGNPTIASVTKTFSAGTTYVGVLNFIGSNQLDSVFFTADLSSVMTGRSRLLVINATHDTLTAVLKNATLTQTATLTPNALGNFLPSAGMYSASVESGATTVAGPINVTLLPRNVQIFVFAGSTSNNSVQLLGPKVIWDVF
ncbi:MAG: DUF4397 domain-containing protein [Silvibacterium sp.]|nr:DUF4397 domain-containing protein [Silvibacterium sp.]